MFITYVYYACQSPRCYDFTSFVILAYPTVLWLTITVVYSMMLQRCQAAISSKLILSSCHSKGTQRLDTTRSCVISNCTKTKTPPNADVTKAAACTRRKAFCCCHCSMSRVTFPGYVSPFFGVGPLLACRNYSGSLHVLLLYD